MTTSLCISGWILFVLAVGLGELESRHLRHRLGSKDACLNIQRGENKRLREAFQSKCADLGQLRNNYEELLRLKDEDLKRIGVARGKDGRFQRRKRA